MTNRNQDVREVRACLSKYVKTGSRKQLKTAKALLTCLKLTKRDKPKPAQ